MNPRLARLSSLAFAALSTALTLATVQGQQVVLSDNFDDGVLLPHWSLDDRPFETGTVDVGGGIIEGAMQLEVTALSDFWGGFALKTERTFAASEADPLTIEITRVLDDGVGITRSGVWISNSDRSQYVFFGQNIGEGGWQYNRRIGQEGDNPTGAGMNIDAFDPLDEDFGSHEIRLVANGSTVELYLDDQLGAEVDFPLTEEIVFAFGSYARFVEDDAVAAFDNVEIKSDLATGLPCVTLSSPSAALFAGESSSATLSAPRLYMAENAATVTVTSSDPEVATLEGANANGELTVNFTPGGDASKPLRIIAGKGGSATFSIGVSDPLCAGSPLGVSVSSAFIRNPSFEDRTIADLEADGVVWPFYTAISDWMGGGGINDGGPFGDNGLIPDGNQIGFSQGASELSQELTGLDTDKIYHLQFYYNARNCCGGSINLDIRFEDQAIGETLTDVRPVGGNNPYHLFTGTFQPATDSGFLAFTTTADGDATIVFDAITVVERGIDDLLLVNSSFEASGRVAAPGYLERIAGWDASGQFGVNVGGTGPFADNGETPDQDSVAFLQEEGSSLSQASNAFVVGETYTLSYAVNARSGNAPSLRVSLDDNVLSEEAISPVGPGNPYHLKTVEFTATNVTHIIRFEQTASGDQSVLLDNVRFLGTASDIPCVPVSPDVVNASIGQTGEAIRIDMPEEAVADGPVMITVTNSNSEAFQLEGAGADGSVTLEFSQGGELSQAVTYTALARGQTTFALSSSKTLCFESTGVSATALAAFVRNPGFESNYTDTWPHYGQVDEWASIGGGGTNKADGPFHDNGLIPDGSQIGFVQGSSHFKQLVGGLEVGQSYWLQFFYNTRDCCGGSTVLTVTYGDQELFSEGPLTPVEPEDPYHFTAISFIPETSAGELTFQGTAEGDATFLLDAITLVKRDDSQILLVNPSFEATGALTLPSPGYLGQEDAEESFALAGWEASGNYGVNSSGNGVFADNGNNSDQDDVVFLQGAGSSIRQTVGGLTAGQAYTLTYTYNARSGNTPTLQVDIDGNLAQEATVLPVGGSQPYHQHSFSFQASGPTAELVFTQTGVGDQTVLIDDVRIAPGGEARPCITVTPGTISVDEGTNGEVTVRVPDEAFDTVDEISVTFASDNPGVAQLEGSTDGTRTLSFQQAGERSLTVGVTTGVVGTATLSITASEVACLSREAVTVNVNELVIPRNLLANGGFEANSSLEFPGYGPVEGWIKEGGGNSGINGPDGPFHNNGVIPDRGQVALMQNSLTLSQTLQGLEAGEPYWLQFFYNVREGFDLPDLTVRIDGQEIVVLEDIEPVSGAEPYHFMNAPFVPEGSSAVLQFESFVEEGGDGTVLLDAVTVTRRDPDQLVVVNPSFEASGLALEPGYIQPESIAGWLIEGDGYGTNRSGEGPFADNGVNPDQDLVLFLQGQTVASQTVGGLSAGQTYTVRFAYNARGGNTPQLVVAVDDAGVFDEMVTPVGGGDPYHQGEFSFTASGDTATFSFGQVAEGDHIILLDDIQVLGGSVEPPMDLPALEIHAVDGGMVELSWPNAFAGLTLEESSGLIDWSASADTAVDRDGRFVVSVQRGGEARYFRLRRP